MAAGGGGAAATRVPAFPLASQPDVIRALQKDQYYLAQLRDDLEEVFAGLFARASGRFKAEVQLLSSALYFGLTTLLGRTTLGEEYCDVLQVQGSPSVALAAPRRAALVALEVLVPYVFERAKRMRSEPLGERASLAARVRALVQGELANAAALWDRYATPLSQLHLALFYLTGRYLQWSKRAARVRYLYLSKPDPDRVGFEVLGVLLLLQLALSALLKAREALAARGGGNGGASGGDVANASAIATREASAGEDEKRADEGDEDDDAASKRKCPLCLERRHRSTATECGHVFCWTCICECCSGKAECPMCRQPVRLERLLLLHEYD